MGVGTTICTILYGIYTALKVTFEAIIPLAFVIVKQILALFINLFSTMNEVFKDVTNLAVTLLAQIQKMIMDILMGLIGNPFEFLCSNMWNCLALLMEILDGNSTFTRLLFSVAGKMFADSGSAFECSRERYAKILDSIKGLLNDFISFKDIVCNFGFTTSFGVEELNNWVKDLQTKFSGWMETCKSAVNYCVNAVEGVEKSIANLGIFELLQKLGAFGNCILENSSICNTFSTVNNFVSDTCSKLCLKQNNTTGMYEFDKGFLEDMNNSFNQSNAFLMNMNGMIDGMVQPGGSIDEMFGGINYSKAYDLTGALKKGYGYITGSESITKDWKNYREEKGLMWGNILDGENKLIVDNNLAAMGLDDVSIGDHEIRYYMPYLYVYKTDTEYKLGYAYKDVTKILHKSDSNKFPTSYSEKREIKVYYPNDSVITNIKNELINELKDFDFELYKKDDYYKTLYCYSQYPNLQDTIKKDDDHINLKECRGGILLYLNCIKGQPFDGTIRSDEVYSYGSDENNKELISTTQITIDSNADIDSLYKPVSIGDCTINIGTLSIAMQDFMNGNKDSELVQSIGEEFLENAIGLGKKIYEFTKINVGELATRYA